MHFFSFERHLHLASLYLLKYDFLSLDNLLIDYQFTFSLLQEDDRHYTAINFMATPEQVIHTHTNTHTF